MRRYLSFVGVGACAAATHFGCAVALVALFAWTPVYANVGGYCAGLLVSFAGQSHLTFGSTQVGVAELAKFTATSLTGFALNALAYATLLRWTSLDYRVALLLVLLGVAALTYVLMSRWVFLQPRRVA